MNRFVQQPGDVTEVTEPEPRPVPWEEFPTPIRRAFHTFIKSHAEIAPYARFRRTSAHVESGVYVVGYRDEVSLTEYEARVDTAGRVEAYPV